MDHEATLFSPCRIGKLTLKNRVVMPPMGTCMGDMNGAVTKRLVDYYVERARGGVGLIIVENTLVTSRYGIQIPNQLRIDSYNHVPFLYELTEAVRHQGARIAVQINVPGSGMRSHLSPGMRPVGPSAVSFDFQTDKCRRLTVKEINEIIKDFTRGARLAKLAGFDAIEIHGAHGYLLNQFLSPYSNRRKDSYGGNLQNRLKFCLEVIHAVRNEVGMEFPLLFRLSVDEFLQNGLTLEEAVEIARAVEKAGIDAFDVSAGNLNMRGSCVRAIPGMFVADGHLADHAGRIRKAIKIPVILAGKIRDPDMAEEILRQGKADFIAVGRGLLSDPEWPAKARRGKGAEIRKCISCNEMCIYQKTWLSHPIRCTVNPRTGNEAQRIEKAEKRKKVLIVGGGPGGMEAARVCALRGHEVSLYEKASALGGQLRMACLLPFKAEIRHLIDCMAAELRNLGVNVFLNKTVPEHTLSSIEFDAIVVATGAVPYNPALPGTGGARVLCYDDVLMKRKPVEGENVIVAGGGLIGCETAIYLAESLGKKVTIVEKAEEIAGDMDPIFNRQGLLGRLEKDAIHVLVGHDIGEISETSIKTVYKGMEKVIPMDNVVLALGRVTENEWHTALQTDVGQVYFVGDCVRPRKLHNAIHEGFWVGLGI